MTLQDALLAATANDTLYLRGGTYVIDATTTCDAAHLLIRNYGSEDVYIRLDSPLNADPSENTRLVIEGDGVRFRGMDGGTLRIGSEPTTRISPDRFIFPDHGGITVEGIAPDDGMFAGVYMHDLISVGYQQVGGGRIADGVVMWNFGFATEGGETDGEFFYLQNPVGSALKEVWNCLFGACYSIVVQVYAESSGQAGIEFRDVLSFAPGSNFYMVGWQEWALMRVRDSVIYGGPLLLGRAGQPNGTVEVLDNTLVGGLQVTEWDAVTVTGNKIIVRDTDDYGVIYKADPVAPVATWNGNAYHNPDNKSFELNPVGFKTFAQWQADPGFDADSTHVTALPTVNVQHVKPLPSGLSMIANIAVLNWEALETVTVDVSALALTQGVTYRLRSITNPFNTAPTADNNVITFVYDGSGALLIPMTGRSMAYPFGASEPITPLDDKWGAWVLEHTA